MAETITRPTEVDVGPALAVQLDCESGSEPREIGAAMESGFRQVMEFIGARGIQLAGPPRAIYTDYGPTSVRFTLAIPVLGPLPDDAEGPVRVGELAGGRTLRFIHVGPYDRLAATYEGITAWMTEEGRMESEADWVKYMPMWEEYVSDPERTAPEELVTYIHLPLPA
jgi:effector-binding domain-containing protein